MRTLPLLPVAHAVRIEAQHLVHEVAGVREIAGVLVTGGGEVELFDTAFALACSISASPRA